MAKLVKCKTCGAEIAKTAKTCPKCGAKQHTVALSLCAVIIVITIIACIGVIAGGGDDSEPKKVVDSTSTPTQSQGDDGSTPEPEKTTFGVGEQVSLNDVVVTMNGVTESSGSQFSKPTDGKTFVLCEFTIENNSEKDLAISSIMSFEAYVDDYSTSISLSAILGSDKNQLDGTIAAGKKMNGIVGYEVPTDWNELEIHFTPNFWSGKDIVFVYSK